ncbi:MAG: RNase adapter RapZ [Firmicutes bacterium]|nr:RNase adapter RapZ [Bacillota bacterium]
MFKLVIITGLSGAGKSQALKSFEDLGYFCIDNLPPALIPKFVDLSVQPGGGIERAALGIDIRGGDFFNDLAWALKDLAASGIGFRILYLDASDEAVIRRFKETRRRHPLAGDGNLWDGIERERARLRELKDRADEIIDTTYLSPHQLKNEIRARFVEGGPPARLMITVTSFGYRFGIPPDTDLAMDVRFLQNPHYVPQLRPLSGLDPQVRDYVLKAPVCQNFLKRFLQLLEFLIPHYIHEGKTQLVVSVGCTGGRHRSVAVAEAVASRLSHQGHRVVVEHRHLDHKTGTETE